MIKSRRSARRTKKKRAAAIFRQTVLDACQRHGIYSARSKDGLAVGVIHALKRGPVFLTVFRGKRGSDLI